MSTTGLAVLARAGGRRPGAVHGPAGEVARPAVRVAAFAALGFYGVLRWSALLQPAPVWRLLGMLAVAVALAAVGAVGAGGGGAAARGGAAGAGGGGVGAGGGAARARAGAAGAGGGARARVITPRGRVALVVLALLAFGAIFPLAGIPLSWVRHVRIGVTASGVGQGLSALPRALVPYTGVNEWVRTDILLGGGLLLITPALVLACAPDRLTDLRRAAAVLPLIALAVIPSTLVRPTLAYGHGLLLFVLIAAFMWGERLRRDDAAIAVTMAALAATAAMVAAPGLDLHRPWLNYEALAGRLAPAHPENFDWTQRYGPLIWPHDGRQVLQITDPRADYWKAEDLDGFDGRGWVSTAQGGTGQDPQHPARDVGKWTHTVHVTIVAMRTQDVIAPGSAQVPDHLPGTVVAGNSPGTWVVPSGLGPGDSYTVQAYSPTPSRAELRAAGIGYPEFLFPAYLTLEIPQARAGNPLMGAAPIGPVSPAFFAPFGSSPQAAYGPTVPNAAAALARSPYAPVYALAQRLRSHAATPYDYVTTVQRYLRQGFVYDQHPPASTYPLVTFLFKTRRGYCQQFAGAMALLLRMGGVPARVATGFATGTRDDATHSWVVTDLDAHAWVEAWFPHYGWVRFEATPSAAPALGGREPGESPRLAGTALPSATPGANGLGAGGTVTPVGRSGRPGGGGTPVLVWVALGLGLLLIALVLVATVRFSEPSRDELLAELERAMARCGRPVATGTTLAALERRFHEFPDAQAYIRLVRLARFAAGAERPSRAQRRALRASLRHGQGARGRLRAAWALPPRLIIRPMRGRGLAGAYTET